MEIAELPREGLLRRFRVALPEAPIAAECARRLAELAAGLDSNATIEKVPRAAMLARSEAAIHADILGRAIEGAVGRILRDHAIRPAGRPAITLEPRLGQSPHIVSISMEALPEITAPLLGDIILEHLLPTREPAEVDAALEALRRRHGVWHDLADTPAVAGDEITADITAWPAPNLLRNPGAQGGGEHPEGLPRHWELLPHGALTATIAGSGPGFLDIRYQGRVLANTRAFLAFESWNAVPAAPGQVFSLLLDLRHIAGTLPRDIVFALTLDEFAEPAPARALLAHATPVMPRADDGTPALVAMAARASRDGALTHIRPALYVGGAAHDAVDFTIRVAAPCLSSTALPPAPPHPALHAEGFAWRLGEDAVLAGLDAGLLGLRAGERRRLALIAPLRTDSLPAELAGRELVMECRAGGLRRLALPALDEAFAARMGQPSLAALHAALAAEQDGQFAAMSARLQRHALLEHLSAMPAELPRTLVDNECRLLAQRAPAGDGAALRALAEQRLRLRMVLRKLGEGFGLAIPASDLEAALAQEAARFPGQEAEALAFLRRNAAAAQRVADQLWTRRVIDHALSLVQLRQRSVAPAALREAAAALDARDPGLDDAHG